MRENYHQNLCGIDEAERGPFAGPLSVAGVIVIICNVTRIKPTLPKVT